MITLADATPDDADAFAALWADDQIAAERGCSRVEWTADTGNRDAQAFYEAPRAKPLTSKIFYRDENLGPSPST